MTLKRLLSKAQAAHRLRILDACRNNPFRMASADSKHNGSANRSPIIVNIGTSPGGVQALQTLFDALPDGTGASLVVIVHLDPQADSDFASILASRTRMPVLQVQTREQIKPNHAYVIPPDRLLQISNHGISAVEFDKPRGQRTAIDLFFRSVAERTGGGFAVILTGADLMAQSVSVPSKRRVVSCLSRIRRKSSIPSMPRSAIATGVADFVYATRARGTTGRPNLSGTETAVPTGNGPMVPVPNVCTSSFI